MEHERDDADAHKCKIFLGSVTLGRLSIDQCDGCGQVGGRHMKLFAQYMRVGTEGGQLVCRWSLDSRDSSF